MKFKTLAVLASLTVCGLVACSSSPQKASSNNSPDTTTKRVADSSNSDNDIVCKRHKPIGSNRTQKTCTTRAQSNAQARRTQEALRNKSAGRGSSRSGDGGGGGI